MKISVVGGIDIPAAEQFATWDYFAAKLKAEGRELDSIVMRVDEEDPDFVGVTYTLKPVPFERLRRITGYLVGTLDRWNNAKYAEQKDRVKHHG